MERLAPVIHTEETGDTLVVITNPMTSQHKRTAKKDIQSRTVSQLSPLPKGALNGLPRDAILDGLTSVESDGEPGSAVFAAM